MTDHLFDNSDDPPRQFLSPLPEGEGIDIVVAVPVTPDFTPGEGSIEWDADCGHKVWISRSTQHYLVQNPSQYLVKCIYCMARDHT